MDLGRRDLREQLSQYAAFERGGEAYVFEAADGRAVDAREALAEFEASGAQPLVFWTVQRYTRV